MPKTLSAAIALTVMLSLTACSAHNSEPATTILPDVPEYSPKMQAKAGVEMKDHCDVMPTVCDTFMPDYKVMRDQTRAAKKILNHSAP